MEILFSHLNFPAQFGAFGAYLARQGWSVTFVTEREGVTPPSGCRVLRMTPHRAPTEGVHRFARPLEGAMINGQAFANAALAAQRKGLSPDIVVAHSGWGAGTFAKAVWPRVKYVSYVEWYYRHPPVDAVGAVPGGNDPDGRALALARNAPTLMDLAEADLVLCPTRFQADQFPGWMRDRITVLHDGVDTDFFTPDPGARPDVPGVALPDDAEIVSYATRGMEPTRGFPEFMRAVAVLQARRPRLHVVIGGQDRVAYGAQPTDGKGWKARMLDELDLDETRLHWPGLLPRRPWRTLLQATHVHVYLTVPFVLSWSMIEAMAAGAPLVVSDCAPVREAVVPGISAEMVDHRDPEALASAIARLLDDRARAARLGQGARAAAARLFAASSIYPAKARLLGDLVR
ncbi:glycosyltransferase [Rhodovulum euryhalinum]|uniref:Glycosyltransferase involved in cell wall biosynthesis n=1 Tax=Rhodovulum euryhalinum TaxID=35805 RepID=A0A4R2KNA5_9RHOB|nr:glycosyltransferase [Rhodovulum euryhalinum]TCO74047.1 glycosyltransferase involved in cell wall biosynthesis [Rhodovulum euryhalinum]